MSGGERMPARRRRALRGSTAATTAVLLASTAHTLAGGDAPPPWLVVAAMILAAPLCVALVGRRLDLPRLSAAVVAAQAILHAAFAAVGTAAPAGDVATAHHHDFASLSSIAVDPAASTMTLGHAIAAVVTIAALAGGERLLATIAHGIRILLRPAAPLPTPPARPRALPAAFLDATAGAVARLAHSVGRRGPPVRHAPIVAG